MESKKKIYLFLFFVTVLTLSGCWDDIEIEERAFLSAIAIDLADENEGQVTIEVTEQAIVPTGLGTITQPEGGESFRNISLTGTGIFEINRNISKQENRKANVEHLGLVIVSTELAEKEGMLTNVLDVFIRQQYMRRGILVAIVDKKAKDLLDVKPEHIKIPANFIIEMLEDEQTAVAKEPVRIGDIQEKLLMNRSYAVPLLTLLPDNTIRYEGVSVIAESPSRMVGTVLGENAKGRHLIIGESQEESVTTDVEGELATFTITEGSSKYNLTNRDKNRLTFQIDIDVTAAISEYYGAMDLFEEENLKKFERALES